MLLTFSSFFCAHEGVCRLDFFSLQTVIRPSYTYHPPRQQKPAAWTNNGLQEFQDQLIMGSNIAPQEEQEKPRRPEESHLIYFKENVPGDVSKPVHFVDAENFQNVCHKA